MDEEFAGDLLSLARNLVSLLREWKQEQALERVHAACRQHASLSYEARAELVHVIDLAVYRLRQERERVSAAIQTLPEDEHAFAKAQIDPILDDINKEIANLLTAKRRWSGPR